MVLGVWGLGSKIYRKERARERDRERERERERGKQHHSAGKGMHLRRFGCPALILGLVQVGGKRERERESERERERERERGRGRARNRLTKNAAQALPDPGSDPEYDGDTWRKAVRAGDGREEQKERERERERKSAIE